MDKYENGTFFTHIENKDSNENLVFIHGSGCNRRFLKPLAKQFPSYNCYLPDLPDHGRSDFCRCKTIWDYVDAIADFVSDLENVTLIGHSLGGTVCLGIAAKCIPSVKRCIIISSGAKYDKLDSKIYTMVQNRKVNWIYLLKCLGSLYCPSVLLDFLSFERSDVILKDFSFHIKLNLEEELDKIKIPTLILTSKEDILNLPEYSHKMHEAIKSSKLVLFSGCRHMLPIAKKRRIAKLIKEFIK